MEPDHMRGPCVDFNLLLLRVTGSHTGRFKVERQTASFHRIIQLLC
jgi:hypothetical protein